MSVWGGNAKLRGLLLGFCIAAVANSSWGQAKEPRAEAQTQHERPCRGISPCGTTNQPRQKRRDVARFAARVEAILSAENASKAEWGILITDEATGEILFARNAQEYFSPASNMKLFTTVLALATLGPDFTFTTTVESTGNVSPDGRVSGDLVLAGAGDPNLSNHR